MTCQHHPDQICDRCAGVWLVARRSTKYFAATQAMAKLPVARLKPATPKRVVPCG